MKDNMYTLEGIRETFDNGEDIERDIVKWLIDEAYYARNECMNLEDELEETSDRLGEMEMDRDELIEQLESLISDLDV